MKDRVEALIKLLFDDDASVTERDEAAIALGEFSNQRTISALLAKAKDTKENELVLNSCGESLGAIWVKQNFFDEKAYGLLPEIVRYGVYVIIKSRKPEWIEQYHLEIDEFMDHRIDLLVQVLFDETSREDEKGDAIMCLGHINSSKALTALTRFASNLNEPDDILEDCGNSIGRICVNLGEFDDKIFKKLAPLARESALLFISLRSTF